MNDKEVIEKLGGSTVVARLLGFTDLKGVRRVNNWKRRGIPAKVKLDNPDLFPYKTSK